MPLLRFLRVRDVRKDLENLPDAERYPKLLARVIGEVARAWRYEMNQALRPLGLNLSMRQVLVQLQRNPGGLMQAELARNLGIEGPTLVRLLDKLEEKGWIARITSLDDRRRKDTVLTARAAEQVRALEQLSDALRTRMMSGLTTEQLDQCARTMLQIRNNLYADRKDDSAEWNVSGEN